MADKFRHLCNYSEPLYFRVISIFSYFPLLLREICHKNLQHYVKYVYDSTYEGGSMYNENPFITPSTNALGSYAICQTKDQSVAVIMVHETLFYLQKGVLHLCPRMDFL